MANVNPRYRVLDGLPPYGPPAEPFPESGQGMHREGFVVEFFDAHDGGWIGNFQRGMTGLDMVAECPDGTSLLVIAGGEAYVIAPDERRCIRTFDGQIEHVFQLPDRFIVSNGLWLEATDGEHLMWRTRRISWDGMRSLRLDSERVLGEAYDPMTDEWVSFSVNLEDGEVAGGSYPVELPR